MGGLTAGLATVIMGMPGSPMNPRSWVMALVLVAAANAAQWLACRHSLAKISHKRDEAARLLQSLLGSEQDFR